MIPTGKVWTYLIAAAAVILCGCGGISSRNIPLPNGSDPGSNPGGSGTLAFLQDKSTSTTFSMQPTLGTLSNSGFTTSSIGSAGEYATITLSPNGQKIASEVFIDIENSGAVRVYTAPVSGSGAVLIADNVDVISPVAFSPDGSKVLWASMNVDGYSDLMEANADGSSVSPTNITNTVSRFFLEGSYSPDGAQIAASVFDGTSYNIALVDSTGAVVNLTANTNSDDEYRFPVFSSDGSKVYFTKGPIGTGDGDVFSVNVNDPTEQGITSANCAAGRFVGSRLTYQCSSTNSVEMFISGADGSSPSALTNNNVFDGYVALYSFIRPLSGSASVPQKQITSKMLSRSR